MRRFRQRFALAILLLALAAAESSWAADYEQRQASGAAVLRLGADRVEKDLAEMSLSTEGATLSFTLEGPAPVVVENEQGVIEAETVAVGGIWNFKRSVERKDLPGGQQRWRLTFQLDPKAEQGKKYPIDHAFLPVPITFRSGSGSPQTATWKQVTVRLTTRVENPDKPTVAQLKDITGIEVTPEEADPKRWVPWLAGAGAILLVSAFVLCLWQFARKRWSVAASLPAEPWALRELDRIENQHLPEKGQVERYHTLLSDVVRQYLERRFRLRAPQQTTAEFLAAMQSWPLLGSAQQAQLREFLERCDLAKFARANPSPEECRSTGEMARTLVRESEVVQSVPTG